MKTIGVNICQEPGRYQDPKEARYSHAEYEGCCILQCSETNEFGEHIGEFGLYEKKEGGPGSPEDS